MSKLERLPGWAKRLDEMSGHFTEAGLNGLLDYHAVTSPLGELLARGEVTPAQIKEFLDGLRKPVASTAALAAGASVQSIWDAEVQTFWTRAWAEILGDKLMQDRKIVVPPLPNMKAKMKIAITGSFGWWIPIFLPANLTEADYPAEFVKPDWGKYLKESDIQRRPLLGRWVMVETISKPNWDDPNGYGNGDDPLANVLELTNRRFNVSWNRIHETHLPETAKLLGLSKKAVRLPTAEEWNLIGNLFLWLNRHRNTTLPDIGSTNSWEWCENAYGDVVRLVVGNRGDGGLGDVVDRWRDGACDDVGFRVLAVL